MNRLNLTCLAIGLLGSTQVIGYLANLPLLRGIGLASGLAPYPKVFCEADGYEPFAARFFLSGINEQREKVSIEFTPELYNKLNGPYLRRNVYGAALAYAPRLSPELHQELMQSLPALAQELELPPLRDVTLTVQPRSGEKVTHYNYPVPDLLPAPPPNY